MFYLSMTLCLVLGVWYAMAYTYNLYFKAYEWYTFQNSNKFAALYDYLLPQAFTNKELYQFLKLGAFGTYTKNQHQAARESVYVQGLAFTRFEAGKEFARLLVFLLAVCIVSPQQPLVGLLVFLMVIALYVGLFFRKFDTYYYPLLGAASVAEYYIVQTKKKRPKSIAKRKSRTKK